MNSDRQTTDHWVVNEECCHAIAKKYGWPLERVYRDREAKGLLPVRCTYSGNCPFPSYGEKTNG